MEYYDELYIDRLLTSLEIQRGLTKFYNVDPDRILISRNHDWVDKTEYDFVCNLTQLGGDFPLELWFLSAHPELHPLSSFEDIGRLCEMLDCRALVGDSTSRNPLAWILIKSVGEYQRVHLDFDAFNANNLTIDLYLEKLTADS